jgi:hypothetical protein
LPEAAIAGLLAAVAGGAVGGFIGGTLAPRETSHGRVLLTRTERLGALTGALVLVAIIAWGVPLSASGPDSATVALRDVPGDGGRSVQATVRVHPADAVRDNPEFFTVTAWQGGGRVLDPLERVGPGVYRTTKAIPVHDGWKATVRLQQGNDLVGVPVYLPEDRAIPKPEVPANAHFTRDFQADKKLLQREQKEGVSGSLWALAYASVLAIVLALAALLTWALLRLEAGGPRRPARARRTPAAKPELV